MNAKQQIAKNVAKAWHIHGRESAVAVLADECFGNLELLEELRGPLEEHLTSSIVSGLIREAKPNVEADKEMYGE